MPLVVSEVNRVLGGHLGLSAETVRWETDARPDVGTDAQDVINRQIPDYDIFVGVMWRRLGTPTKRAKSGTGEEFSRALKSFKKGGRPTIMFYFRVEPFYSTDEKELAQFQEVARFQRELRKLGVLYWTYRTPLEFERHVREHLSRHLLYPTKQRRAAKRGGVAPAPGENHAPVRALGTGTMFHTVFMSYAHADRDRARTLYDGLAAAGHRVWMDVEAVLPGQIWQNEVKAALQRASTLLLLVSDRSSSMGGSIAKELDLAATRIRHGLRVIVARLDPVKVPAPLEAFESVDLFLPEGLRLLLASLQRNAA